MGTIPTAFPTWLTEWMEAFKITLWGAADLRNVSTPSDQTGEASPSAILFTIPMNPKIMVSIQKGPNRVYADEHAGVNNPINELSTALATEIEGRGFQSSPFAASVRIDTDNIKGDFFHNCAKFELSHSTMCYLTGQ